MSRMKIHSDWQVKSCLWACNSPRHLLSIIPSNAPFSTLCFPQICAQVSAAKFFSGLEISGIIFCACVLSSQVFCPAKCDHYTLPHFSFSVFSAEGLCLPSVSYHWLCCHWESTKVVCCAVWAQDSHSLFSSLLKDGRSLMGDGACLEIHCFCAFDFRS